MLHGGTVVVLVWCWCGGHGNQDVGQLDCGWGGPVGLASMGGAISWWWGRGSFEEKFVFSEDAAAVVGELYVTSIVAEFCDGEKGVGREAR